jgi:hypothetical protein
VNGLANVDHPVTDSLQFGGNLHRRGYQPKVSGDGLMKGQELQTHFFQVNIHSVQVAILLYDHASAANVMFTEALERALHLRDDQVSHLTELRSQIGKFEVNVFVSMLHR